MVAAEVDGGADELGSALLVQERPFKFELGLTVLPALQLHHPLAQILIHLIRRRILLPSVIIEATPRAPWSLASSSILTLVNLRPVSLLLLHNIVLLDEMTGFVSRIILNKCK